VGLVLVGRASPPTKAHDQGPKLTCSGHVESKPEDTWAQPYDQEPNGKGAKALGLSAWAHGNTTYDQEPVKKGLRPNLCQKWVFPLYYMIFIDLIPDIDGF
jgi:hypothetical protein